MVCARPLEDRSAVHAASVASRLSPRSQGPLLSLRANCTVLLHAMVHTLPECLDQVLSSKARLSSPPPHSPRLFAPCTAHSKPRWPPAQALQL